METIYIRLVLDEANKLWPDIEFDEEAVRIGIRLAIRKSDGKIHATPLYEYLANGRVKTLEKRIDESVGGTEVILTRVVNSGGGGIRDR